MRQAAHNDRSGTLPLAGIRVVSLEHALAAPICTRHLADLGAEVIKIERPGEGDFSRGYDTFVYGESTYFLWLNRGKSSFALDVKAKGADQVLDRLIRSADVIVQNLAPGAAARAGLDYEAVRKINPRAIVADISGYGEGGSFENKKAYDMLIQAESGLISINGSEDTPARVGLSVADLSTGLYTQTAILAALVRRGQTGEGANVKVAMLDALAEWMTYPMYRHAYNGSRIPRLPMNNPNIAPYGAHATRDGIVIFSIQNEREWQTFCEVVMGQPELTLHQDYRTNSLRILNSEKLTQLIETKFSDKSTQEVVHLLDSGGIANGRLNQAKDLWEHSQLKERDKWRDVKIPGGHTIRALLPPFIFSDFEAVMGDVPALGEQTEKVLRALDFNELEIDHLFELGTVAGQRQALEKNSRS